MSLEKLKCQSSQMTGIVGKRLIDHNPIDCRLQTLIPNLIWMAATAMEGQGGRTARANDARDIQHQQYWDIQPRTSLQCPVDLQALLLLVKKVLLEPTWFPEVFDALKVLAVQLEVGEAIRERAEAGAQAKVGEEA